MKNLGWLLVLAGIWCPPLFAQDKNPVATFIRQALAQRSKEMLAAAQEMPADKYDFKAPPDQATFGYLTLHVAVGNYLYCAIIGGVPAPELPEVRDTDPKDKLLDRMKSSFDFCATALATLDDSKMSETLTIGETKASRAMTILALSSSWATHYSLQESYLQLGGQVPPTANK
jgi:hypothetical protein